jgi:plastocyanin
MRSLLALFSIAFVYAAQAETVDFYVKPGTGNAAWNNRFEPIKVRVGDTLVFHNEDQVSHTIHTDGVPFGHGSAFGPGETFTTTITAKHDAAAGDLYDHNYGRRAQIYIQAD